MATRSLKELSPSPDTMNLSNRVHEFQQTFNSDITQFIEKIESMERTIAELHKHSSPRPFLAPEPDMVDVQRKEKAVHTFFFRKDYTEALGYTPQSMSSEAYQSFLVNLSKYHYEAAKNVWLNEAKKLLADLFRHHGDIDNAKVNHLEQVGVAYNILLSLISPLRKVELCENIRKEVIYQMNKKEAMKTSYEKCRRNRNNMHYEQFVEFNKKLADVSATMVSISPPMILHSGQHNLNPLWVESQSKPPLHWIRPIILKNHIGSALVQGITEGRDDYGVHDQFFDCRI